MTGIEPSAAFGMDASIVPTPQASPRRRRPWRAKFKDAFRGLKWGVRGHSSFFVHFFAAALVLAAGLILGCSLIEWSILLGCIGLVLTAELFNSAIETLFRGLDEATKERVWPALNISAGAVLLSSFAASAVGLLLLLPKLAMWLGLL